MRARAQRVMTSMGARQGLLWPGPRWWPVGLITWSTWLSAVCCIPTEFSVFVAVTALLQVAVHVANVIRNVVAFYTAELTVQPNATAKIGVFLAAALALGAALGAGGNGRYGPVRPSLPG
jgi:hypothetical protein